MSSFKTFNGYEVEDGYARESVGALGKIAPAIGMVEGTGVTITDSTEGVVIDLEVDGRSTQTQTNGYQLFDASKLTTTSGGGVTVTNNGDGSFTISGSGAVTETVTTMTYKVSTDDFLQLFKAGRLYLKTEKSTTPDLYVNLYKDGVFDKTLLITRNVASMSVELLEEYFDGTYSLVIGFSWMQVGATITTGTIKPMLYQDGGGTWEEFSGGKVSPSPDYPQAIKSVGDMGYFDGELLQGYYNVSNGSLVSTNASVCSRNPIPCKANDNIKLEYDGEYSAMYVLFYDENMNVLSYTTVGNATVPSNACYFTFNINSASSITPQTAKHICVTINDKYALIVDSKGKNELENIATSSTSGGITVTVNDDKSIDVKGTANVQSGVSKWVEVCNKTLPRGSYILSGSPNGAGSGSYSYYIYIGSASGATIASDYTFTLAEDTTVKVQLRIPLLGQTIDTTFYPMIRPQGTDATYEPYKKSRKYIPISAPLRGIGDVTDVASLSERKVTRKFAEVVFDGSSDEVWSLKTIGCELYLNNTNSGNALCTHYKKNNGVSWGDLQGNEFNIIGTVLRIKDNTHQSTLDEWKSWLQANPITVQYELAEPTTERIELIDVDTFEGVTQISVSDNAGCKVSYYRNNEDGKKMRELDNRMVTAEDTINNLESNAVAVAGDIEDIKTSMNENPLLVTLAPTDELPTIVAGSTVGSFKDTWLNRVINDYEYLIIVIRHRNGTKQIVQIPSMLIEIGGTYTFPFNDVQNNINGAYITINSATRYGIGIFGTLPDDVSFELYKYGKPISVG